VPARFALGIVPSLTIVRAEVEAQLKAPVGGGRICAAQNTRVVSNRYTMASDL
jgi:hypothetical protein